MLGCLEPYEIHKKQHNVNQHHSRLDIRYIPVNRVFHDSTCWSGTYHRIYRCIFFNSNGVSQKIITANRIIMEWAKRRSSSEMDGQMENGKIPENTQNELFIYFNYLMMAASTYGTSIEIWEALFAPKWITAIGGMLVVPSNVFIIQNSSLYHIVLYAERLRFIILILPEHLSCDRYFSISILFILFYILAFVNKLCTSTGV